VIAVVLELFCGTARFARAMESHRPVMRWDILFGDKYDLRTRANQELVLGWLRAGWLAAVWLGTPCQSFSRARNQPGGPPALRDKLHVHGLPDRRPCDQAAIELGNILARFSSRVLLQAALLLVPAVMENPALSWIWQTRWLTALARRRDFTFTVTDFVNGRSSLSGSRRASFIAAWIFRLERVAASVVAEVSAQPLMSRIGLLLARRRMDASGPRLRSRIHCVSAERSRPISMEPSQPVSASSGRPHWRSR
jgi:hypothetical protein